MSQRLAIVISGAVSLGSYEAGVIYEIVEAIAQHNEDSKTSEDKKIEIDVITGASAGAMTACILAQKLLFDADALKGTFTNDLFRPWVEDVDIDTLLSFDKDEDPNLSILSSNLIKEIGHKYLLRRFNDVNPPSKRHPAAASSIHLGIAMSNLKGFDFQKQMVGFANILNQTSTELAFTYTEHKDRLVREITQENNNKDFWTEIELASRSSGAFPFAFRVLDVKRKSSDEVYEKAQPFAGEKVNFPYTDGGVFENEPLGMAKMLVNQVDTDPLDYEKRFYLYVSPGPKSSTVLQSFEASQASYVKTAIALAYSIFTQARFQDWIKTSDINEAIQQLDTQAQSLKRFLQHSPQIAQELKDCVDEMLKALYLQTQQPNQNLQPTREEDFERLKSQYNKEFQEISGLGETVASAWLETVQVLEKSANLGTKDKMKIYAITAEDNELAGVKLSAFAGFFAKPLRKFDYNVGRKKAVEFLNNLKQLHVENPKTEELFLVNFTTNTISDEPSLTNTDLARISKETRIKVKVRILDRLNLVIENLENRWFVRQLLKLGLGFFFSKILDETLKLNQPESSNVISSNNGD